MARVRRKKLWASFLCIMVACFLLMTFQRCDFVSIGRSSPNAGASSWEVSGTKQVVNELGKFERLKIENSNLKDEQPKPEQATKHLHPFLKKGLYQSKKKVAKADSYPIMLWWSPLTGETGRLGHCGADTCFFTINRSYQHHQLTKAFLFYALKEPEADPVELRARSHMEDANVIVHRILWPSLIILPFGLPVGFSDWRRRKCHLSLHRRAVMRAAVHHAMDSLSLWFFATEKELLKIGTDFSIDSLPLPRKAHHDWALFHEESPKNNYKLFHEPVITLFNHTATFSRHSHLPLTTQYLEGVDALKSLRYMVPLHTKNSLRQRLAPLVYVQSDCDPPSDRDSYVRELMSHIQVDSYGECLRNRDLPPQLKNPASMDDDGFYRILAQYKFILAFENAVCDDYITEKFWRPLKLGVVPVYYGSPSITDWLPSNKSAVLVTGFSHPRELAGFIKQLDNNDKEYEAYIAWKLKGEISNHKLLTALKERRWGVQDITQDNYIDAFECMVCNKVWENIRLQEKGFLPRRWNAEVTHLSCPKPQAFGFPIPALQWTSLREMWIPSFEQSKKEARALRQLVERNRNFTAQEFWTLVFQD